MGSVKIFKYELRNGHTCYTLNADVAVMDGNKPLAVREVELPEGVKKLSTHGGIVLKKGSGYAPVLMAEGGRVVADILGAGQVTLCEEF